MTQNLQELPSCHRRNAPLVNCIVRHPSEQSRNHCGAFMEALCQRALPVGAMSLQHYDGHMQSGRPIQNVEVTVVMLVLSSCPAIVLQALFRGNRAENSMEG